jgi:hypothetical protein
MLPPVIRTKLSTQAKTAYSRAGTKAVTSDHAVPTFTKNVKVGHPPRGYSNQLVLIPIFEAAVDTFLATVPVEHRHGTNV